MTTCCHPVDRNRPSQSVAGPVSRNRVTVTRRPGALSGSAHCRGLFDHLTPPRGHRGSSSNLRMTRSSLVVGARPGSQVGSHSLWTAADGYRRLWTASRLFPDGMDGCGRARTACVHLRIRRLGIRVPPGVLLTRASAQTSSAQTARKTAPSSGAVNRRLAKSRQGSTFPVYYLHAPTTHPRRTHDAPTDPRSRPSNIPIRIRISDMGGPSTDPR